jgi:hypothetical protein
VITRCGGPATIVKLNAWLKLRDSDGNVSVTTNVEIPEVVGVPEIEPSVENARPAGNVPEVSCHPEKTCPPLYNSVCEYGAPTNPAGRFGGVRVLAD